MCFFRVCSKLQWWLWCKRDDHQEKRQEHCPSSPCLMGYPQKAGLLSTEGIFLLQWTVKGLIQNSLILIPRFRWIFLSSCKLVSSMCDLHIFIAVFKQLAHAIFFFFFSTFPYRTEGSEVICKGKHSQPCDLKVTPAIFVFISFLERPCFLNFISCSFPHSLNLVWVCIKGCVVVC